MKFSLTLLTATIATIVAAAPAQYTGQAIDSNQVVEIPESAVEAYFPIEDELTPVFGEIDNKPVILIVNGTTLTSGANNEKEKLSLKVVSDSPISDTLNLVKEMLTPMLDLDLLTLVILNQVKEMLMLKPVLDLPILVILNLVNK